VSFRAERTNEIFRLSADLF